MSKNLNDRCPLQAECERTCKYKGRELDCDYYEVNARGELMIEDQENRRREIERRRDEESWERELAELRNEKEFGETVLVHQTETKVVRTVDVIAAEIRAFTASMLGNIIEIGRRMVEAKELLPHGEFGPWLKANTGYSTSKANDYMRIFREYGSPQASLFGAEVANCQTYGNLNYSQALALLDVPAEEREAFVLEHNVEDMSTRELKQAIKERDEARNKISDMEADMDDLRDDLQRAKSKASDAEQEVKAYNRTVKRLEKELADLKAKPVEVAVEADQEAINKAVKEATEQFQLQLESVKEDKSAEIDKLTRHLQSVMADKEKADQELETARKNLSDAQARLEEAQQPKDTAQRDKEQGEYKAYFNQAIDAANKMRGILLKARGRGDTETAEKLKKAMKALEEAIGRAAE